jgi:hypothetical protein
MTRNAVIDGNIIIGPLGPTITDGFILIEALLPVGGICYDVAYLTRRTLRRDHFLKNMIIQADREPIVSHCNF